MLFEDITILDENLDVRQHQYVGVKNGKINYIGGSAPKEEYKTCLLYTSRCV